MYRFDTYIYFTIVSPNMRPEGGPVRNHATQSLKVKSSWRDDHLLEDVAGSWYRVYADNLFITLGTFRCAKEMCIHLADT